MSEANRVVGVPGNPEDVTYWSGTAYFFLKAGKQAGFFKGGLRLDPKLRVPKFLWNAAAPLRGERTGGYQFSKPCMDRLMEHAVRSCDLTGGTEIVSFFQLFPPFEKAEQMGIRYAHYIDFPLLCFFDGYGYFKKMGEKSAQKALEREREQYARARAVVCMSGWAARQVVELCGTPASKVHVILPGANLPDELFDTAANPPVAEESIPDGKKVPLRIAFVGKFAVRKGLPQLVEAIRILRRRGYKSVVRVIGPAENLYPNDPEVEHLGFINKSREPMRLIQELRSCHIGALPSRQEAFGIAALEYLRCGLPAMLTKVGGLQDSVPENCAIFLSADCGAEEIADRLEDLLKRPDYFVAMRAEARKQAPTASWVRTIREFQDLWKKLG